MFRKLIFATCLAAAPASAAPGWGVTAEPSQQGDRQFCTLWYGDGSPHMNFFAASDHFAVSVRSDRLVDIAEAAPINVTFSGSTFTTGPTQVSEAGVHTGFVMEWDLDDMMSNLAVAGAYDAPFAITLDGYTITFPVGSLDDRVAIFAGCRDQLPAG